MTKVTGPVYSLIRSMGSTPSQTVVALVVVNGQTGTVTESYTGREVDCLEVLRLSRC